MSTQSQWTGVPLPRGRHKLSRDEVLASQRGRLLRAMEELVGAVGYESTTVPQVIKAARVSTATFYRLFADKIDCFIALCEERGERLLSALMPDQDELRSIDLRASVMVTTELIASEIRRGNVGRLIELRDDLRRLLLKLLGPAGLELELGS